MQALFVVLTLLAGPANGPVAVQWRGADSPDERARVAVREAVAGVDGRPVEAVPDHALDRARVAVSREHPASIRTLRAELRTDLDAADTAYREGRFVDARSLLDELLASLRTHPEVPGAAASAREAHLLAARIAWAEGDQVHAEEALVAALRLDPEARLSARRAPPELIERYDALQAALLAERERWVTPSFSVEAEVEIDGVLGLRPVPPGPHFVVLFRDGLEPTASWRELDRDWTIPAASERISSEPDREHQSICEALGLELLVLAEQRGSDIGVQGYRCGVGYGPVWTGKREGLAAGAVEVVGGPFDASSPSLTDAWSKPAPVPAPIDDGEPAIPGPRPWYRKGWVWGTSAGVAAAIAGGVVAGVLLGGRQSPASVEIDANDFIGGH